ncbi:unnamed protein product [Pipistrellus nathusii]|uniref:Uncharacterized protein n=1 Tax=Pipistrellus nathusii TaxID=59473 RepID=A0ABN9Z796_PIPNA
MNLSAGGRPLLALSLDHVGSPGLVFLSNGAQPLVLGDFRGRAEQQAPFQLEGQLTQESKCPGSGRSGHCAPLQAGEGSSSPEGRRRAGAPALPPRNLASKGIPEANVTKAELMFCYCFSFFSFLLY